MNRLPLRPINAAATATSTTVIIIIRLNERKETSASISECTIPLFRGRGVVSLGCPTRTDGRTRPRVSSSQPSIVGSGFQCSVVPKEWRSIIRRGERRSETTISILSQGRSENSQHPPSLVVHLRNPYDACSLSKSGTKGADFQTTTLDLKSIPSKYQTLWRSLPPLLEPSSDDLT